MFESLNRWIKENLRRQKLADEAKPEAEIHVSTAPLTETQINTITRTDHHLEPPQLIACSALDPGRERDENQDALFTFSANLAGENTDISYGIFIIADGLGGHELGSVASRVAAQTMASHMLSKYFFPYFGLKDEKPQESIQEILETGVKLADQAVKREAPQGGTTITAVMVLGKRMTIAHVGDSRAYSLLPNGQIEALTRDHSFAQRLLELGQISPEEAASHPKRHDLYRALGLEISAEPDISTAPLPKAGHLLVCSDGLWGVIPEADIVRLVHAAPNLKQACASLIEAANAAGGPDNISAILVRLPD